MFDIVLRDPGSNFNIVLSAVAPGVVVYMYWGAKM
jgi:hypothetical protein